MPIGDLKKVKSKEFMEVLSAVNLKEKPDSNGDGNMNPATQTSSKVDIPLEDR